MRLRVIFEFTGTTCFIFLRFGNDVVIGHDRYFSGHATCRCGRGCAVHGRMNRYGDDGPAICVGLIGVVIVLRPSSDDFSVLSILAVVGMLGFAGRDLASRAAPVSLTPSVLGIYGFLTFLAGRVLWRFGKAKPMSGLTCKHRFLDPVGRCWRICIHQPNDGHADWPSLHGDAISAIFVLFFGIGLGCSFLANH